MVLAVVTAFLCPTSLPADIIYKVIDLGTLGGDYSIAYSINNAGQIVGYAANSEGDWRATLFDPTGAVNNIDLGTIGGDESGAFSINDAGQIVGEAQNSQGWYRATLFDPSGVNTTETGNNIDLGTLGGYASAARSINDAGQIVGKAINSQGEWSATLFDPTGAGNNIDLGTLGGYRSGAYSINDAGQIVGEAINSQGWDHATLFDPTGSGNNIDLGTLGGEESYAWSINDAGQIVGLSHNSQVWPRATLFDPTGSGNNIDLGTLGGTCSQALSINNAGQIVGYAADDSQVLCHATLFDPSGAGNNIDLNTLIDPASGWTLTYNAYDINASGWIVGQGYNQKGERHAFLLVPKQPCLYTLAGDLNDDCKVDFADFAVMATNWLVDCELHPTDPACVPK